MDSAAFSTLSIHGKYPQSAGEYVQQIRRWQHCGTLHAAVTQDFMCEPHMLTKTGCTIAEHQALTVARYDVIRSLTPPDIYIMPVLQGWMPSDYVTHLNSYGARLSLGAWVGVGSICKRNSTPAVVYTILHTIKSARPDLRLHGFGLKITTLQSSARDLLYSADSMAWSFRARKQGRNPNDWQEADQFVREIQ